MRRSLRPNIQKSYTNTCGAPAPQGTLHSPVTIPKKPLAVKKAKQVVGGILCNTISGERQTAGAVSLLFHSFLHSATGCSSGAVVVEMEGSLFYALNAKSFHSVLTV